MENATHSFRETNLVLENCDDLELPIGKRRHFL